MRRKIDKGNDDAVDNELPPVYSVGSRYQEKSFVNVGYLTNLWLAKVLEMLEVFSVEAGRRDAAIGKQEKGKFPLSPGGWCVHDYRSKRAWGCQPLM